MRVLMITQKRDPHVDSLAETLARRNVEVARFNIDELPDSTWSDLAISNGEVGLRLPDGTTDADAVFYRRLVMVRGHALWRHIPPDRREFVVAEAEAALFGICHALEDRCWINSTKGREIYTNKPAGLMIARQAGLTIPDTLITNDPEKVASFYDASEGRIIFKAACSAIVRRYQNGEGGTSFFTTRISRRHIEEHGNLIQAVPGIYQVEVPRKEELRITIVDDRIFCARMIAPQADEVDWRRGTGKGLRSERATLPRGLDVKLMEFMKIAKLRYAAIDVIITPEGDAVFLEANPQGAYLWLEHDLGFPITAAIADGLTLK